MSGTGRGRGGGKGAGRVKRQQVESEDGWTVITHGVSKMSVNNPDSTATTDSKKTSKNGMQVAGQMPSQTVQGMTAEKLQGEFETLREKWADSDVGRQLRSLLREQDLMSVVREAVCIGIGSFSRDWEHRWRSMWQLVLFIDVVAQIEVKAVHAQDPAFTSLDIEFLKLLNVTAVDDGLEKHITAESFVFSPFVDWFTLLPVFLKERDPALYVGNEILDDYTAFAQSEEKRAKLEECNVLGKAFLEKREVRKVKEFEGHAHALNGMVVYIKEAEASTATATTTTTLDTTDTSAPT